MISNDPTSTPAERLPKDAPKAAKPANAGGLARASRIVKEDTEAVHLRIVIANALLFFLPRGGFSRLRGAIYRAMGVSIGRGFLLLGSITLSGAGPVWKRLSIGNDCQFNSPIFMDLNADVTIGNRVSIGHHVTLITSHHEIGPTEHRCGILMPRPIVIEDGSWVGARTTILPGVTIGKGAIVAAGAVVTADVAPDTLVGGVPARPVKRLPERSESLEIKASPETVSSPKEG